MLYLIECHNKGFEYWTKKIGPVRGAQARFLLYRLNGLSVRMHGRVDYYLTPILDI